MRNVILKLLAIVGISVTLALNGLTLHTGPYWIVMALAIFAAVI